MLKKVMKGALIGGAIVGTGVVGTFVGGIIGAGLGGALALYKLEEKDPDMYDEVHRESVDEIVHFLVRDVLHLPYNAEHRVERKVEVMKPEIIRRLENDAD